MTSRNDIAKLLPFSNYRLKEEVIAGSVVKEIPADTVILEPGQHVRVVPFVLDGLIKVYTRHEEKELLLYYIKQAESCIMSFSAGIRNEPSRVRAITGGTTSALLLPVERISEWSRDFPEFNSLFFNLFTLRYNELVDSLRFVLFENLDQRLYHYLDEKAKLSGDKILSLSHRQIASDLGTAREVVSRLLKKLESEDKIIQHGSGIEIKGL